MKGGLVAAAGPACPDGEFTFGHDEVGPGEHWFFASDETGLDAGFAHVQEKPAAGASAAHVLIEKLYVRPGHRGKGIGTRLLEDVATDFARHELRLKPYPIEDGELDEDQLREFYARRGFGDYEPAEFEGWDAWEYLSRPGITGPAGQQPAGVAAQPPGLGPSGPAQLGALSFPHAVLPAVPPAAKPGGRPRHGGHCPGPLRGRA